MSWGWCPSIADPPSIPALQPAAGSPSLLPACLSAALGFACLCLLLSLCLHLGLCPSSDFTCLGHSHLHLGQEYNMLSRDLTAPLLTVAPNEDLLCAQRVLQGERDQAWEPPGTNCSCFRIWINVCKQTSSPWWPHCPHSGFQVLLPMSLQMPCFQR